MKNIVTIWKKEMTDSLRDRRTLMAMIVIPMLMMPLLTIGMFKFLDKIMAEQQSQSARVAIIGKNNSPELAEIIKKQARVEMADIAADAQDQVKDEKIDAAVIIPDNFKKAVENRKPVDIELVIKSTNSKSANAVASVMAASEIFNAQILEERFAEQNINQEILSKVAVRQDDVATEQETGGLVLGLLIPMFIVMWAIAGGQYIAIDVSAGEKERKTLESLLMTPAKRIEIVLGKFLAVSTAAMVSVVIAIGSFYIALVYSGGFGPMSQRGEGIPGTVPVNFSVELQAIVVLIATSVFLVLMFSAVILSIAIFAKSFKEAQSYIGPSYLVVIIPVVMANSIPGFKAADWFFAIPAVNAVLLFKEVLVGTYNVMHIAVTIISLIIYSVISIVIAGKIYSKESVLFKD